MDTATTRAKAQDPPDTPPRPDDGPCDRSIADRLPRRLRRGRWFVAWRWEWRDGTKAQAGKWTKVPVNPGTGGRASSTSKKTWGTLEAAITHAVQHELPGIGVMFQGSGLFGIDLDGCLDPCTGELDAWATAILARFPGAWREKSPSGTGIHLIGQGKLPGKGHNVRRPEGGGVECYDAGRFFTLTGAVLPDSPPEPGDCQEAVTAWYLETFPPPAPAPRSSASASPLSGSDEALLDVARKAKNGAKFVQLYDRGDWQGAGFGSPSEADLSLCNTLAFYLGNDASRIDRAFRASGLYRPKWDRLGIAGETIRKAIAATGSTYRPPLHPKAQTNGHTNGAYAAVLPAQNDVDDGDSDDDGNIGGDSDGGSGGGAPDRPQIDTTVRHMPTLAQQAWDALTQYNSPPQLFRRGGELARLEADQRSGRVELTALTEDRLKYHLERAAFWYRWASGGKDAPPIKEPEFAPLPVVKDLLATPRPPVPDLDRVVAAPVFAADGTLQTTPGYHPASYTYYQPPAGAAPIPPVPSAPTADDLAQAKRWLFDELLHDFPITTDPGKAYAAALFLQPYIRDLIDGPTPLYLIDKPAPGTGGTFVAEVLLLPAIGAAPAMMTEATAEEEWKKVILARLMTRPEAVIIDNLQHKLDSPTLASVLTMHGDYTDRLLGASEMVSVPVRCAFIATGNNPILEGQMPRRRVKIHLDAGVQDPALRPATTFKHYPLQSWVKEHRHHLVWSALVMVQAWLAADRPQGQRTLGSFESWAGVIGGILDTARIPGFLTDTESVSEGNDEFDTWGTLVDAWWDKFTSDQVTARDVFPLVDACDIPLKLGRIEGGGAAPGAQGGGIDPHRGRRITFGLLLRGKRDRIFNGKRITATSTKINNVAGWFLQVWPPKDKTHARTGAPAPMTGSTGSTGDAPSNSPSVTDPASNLGATPTTGSTGSISTPCVRARENDVQGHTHSVDALARARSAGNSPYSPYSPQDGSLPDREAVGGVGESSGPTPRPTPPTPPGVPDAPSEASVPSGVKRLDPSAVQEYMDAGLSRSEAIDRVTREGGATISVPAPAGARPPAPPPGCHDPAHRRAGRDYLPYPKALFLACGVCQPPPAATGGANDASR